MRHLRSSCNNALIIGCSGKDMVNEHRNAGAVLSWSKPLPSDLRIKSDLCLALAVRRELIRSGSDEPLNKITIDASNFVCLFLSHNRTRTKSEETHHDEELYTFTHLATCTTCDYLFGRTSPQGFRSGTEYKLAEIIKIRTRVLKMVVCCHVW